MTEPVGPDALHAALRAWARGSLPLMAAVDFVIATGTDLSPFVEQHEGRTILDLFVRDDQIGYLTPADWERVVGPMSGGQRATWELARSIADGELEQWFWRLDAQRKYAFAVALVGSVQL